MPSPNAAVGLASRAESTASASSIRAPDHAHAPAAAAGRRLHEQRVADASAAAVVARRRRSPIVIPGSTGTPAASATRLRLELRAHHLDGLGRRARRNEAGGRAGPGEVGAVRTGSRSRGGRRRRRCGWRRRSPQVDAQVGVAPARGRAGARLRRPGARSGASASASENTATVAIPSARGGADDAFRDLAAVGDEQLRDHRLHPEDAEAAAALDDVASGRPTARCRARCGCRAGR